MPIKNERESENIVIPMILRKIMLKADSIENKYKYRHFL